MADRICPHCDKPVTLTPSAVERAKRYGKTPEYYRALFPAHAECVVRVRAQDVKALIDRHYANVISQGSVIRENGHKHYGGGSK